MHTYMHVFLCLENHTSTSNLYNLLEISIRTDGHWLPIHRGQRYNRTSDPLRYTDRCLFQIKPTTLPIYIVNICYFQYKGSSNETWQLAYGTGNSRILEKSSDFISWCLKIDSILWLRSRQRHNKIIFKLLLVYSLGLSASDGHNHLQLLVWQNNYHVQLLF